MTPDKPKDEGQTPEEVKSMGISEDDFEQEQAYVPPSGEEAPPHPLLGGPGETLAPENDDERTWAVVAHGSALVTILIGLLTGGAVCLVGPLVPLVIWLVFRERSRFVARHALQATLFQAALMLAVVVFGVLGGVILAAAWAATVALMGVAVGICLIPVALLLTLVYIIVILGLPVAALVYAVYGAYEVSQGRDFSYWLVGNWAS